MTRTRSHIATAARLLGGLTILGALTAVAIGRAAKQGPGSDFHVFWHAGYQFAHGLPLYDHEPGMRSFLYPPFAAQTFQVLSLFPLKVAAGLFYLANIGLIGAAIWLSWDIVRRLRPDARSLRLALILAIVFSGQFVLNNLNLLQMNLVTFVLSLLGIRGIIQGRPRAMIWLVVATALKITPIFLVFWGAIRGGRRAFTVALLAGVACIVLPGLQRGPTVGIDDMKAYHAAFLRQFAAGAVITDYTNQNLAAMIYRATTPPEKPERYNYQYLPSLRAAAPLLYRTFAVLIVVGFVARLLWLARAARPITPLEIAGVFLVSHLLSGITWKAHLVTLLFVYYSFLSLDRRSLEWVGRVALVAAWVGMGLVGFAGRDLWGDTAHHYFGGYSVFVWLMLLLLTLCVTLPERNAAKASSPAGGAAAVS